MHLETGDPRRLSLGLLHRLVISASLAVSTFYYTVSYHIPGFPRFGAKDPAWWEWVVGAIVKLINLPVAVVAAFAPNHPPLDLWFRTYYDFVTTQEMLYWHLGWAIPTYVALLYIPACVAFTRRLRSHARNR